MALLRFFKVPKHQQYEYKPRYWDPRKEELEDRLKRIDKIKGRDAEAVKARLSGGFRRGFEATGVKRSRRGQVMRSNLILVGIIVILLLLSYLLLTVYLPEVVDFIEPADPEF